MHLELTSLVVHDYDHAIAFFVDVLGFDLVEDSPSTSTKSGEPKRWVVVRPPGRSTGLLLAKADGDRQVAAVGDQYAGRVGLFLRVDDFDATYERMAASGVEFVGEPSDEPFGRYVVFADMAGNRWDLLGPDPRPKTAPAKPLTVRRERAGDVAAVRAIQVAAFDQGDGQPVEAPLLDALRTDGWIPELSWVAEIDGEIVGHNICSRGRVDDVACVGLGPIGVDPSRQHSGIGSALMAAMIGAADARGEPLIALLGNPEYYKRFGFVASSELQIVPPEPAWGPFFQVRRLSTYEPTMTGQFHYAAPFNDLD